jgi:hypothetical protein
VTAHGRAMAGLGRAAMVMQHRLVRPKWHAAVPAGRRRSQ